MLHRNGTFIYWFESNLAGFTKNAPARRALHLLNEQVVYVIHTAYFFKFFLALKLS